MVFSILPFSTTAVVISDFFKEDLKKERSSIRQNKRSHNDDRGEYKFPFFLTGILLLQSNVSITYFWRIRFNPGAKHKLI